MFYKRKKNFVLLFSKSRRKCPRPQMTIYNHESDRNKKYLSVRNFRVI